MRPGHPRWLRVGSTAPELQAQVLAKAGAKAGTITLGNQKLSVGRHTTTTTALDLPFGGGGHAGKVHASAAHGPVTVSIAALGHYSASSTQVLTPVAMSGLSAPKTLLPARPPPSPSPDMPGSRRPAPPR